MRRGFTLVEVLVALLILALMATLAWRGVDGMLRARDISQAQLDRSARLHTVMAQWQQDLEQVQDTQLIPALRFDGRHLRLTRRQPEGLQVVVWWLAEGKLQRWASAPVRNLQALRQSFEESQQPLALASRSLSTLEGVAGWQMAYYFNNAWANAQSSGDLVEDAALRDKREREAGSKPQQPDPQNPQGGQGGQGGQAGQGTQGPTRATLPKAVRMQLDFEPGQFGGPLVRQVLLGAS
ncbi:type II secretion system protein J [Inhella sp.]|uniref:PulJ/GspJ family protein n=1 Tax=Inhella sp. TaxID=1921806 RepID=UPI0035B33939